MKISDLSGRLMCWRLWLSEYKFTVKYKKGKNKVVADMLSRGPTDGEARAVIDAEFSCFLIEHNRFTPDLLVLNRNYKCSEESEEEDPIDGVEEEDDFLENVLANQEVK